MAIAWSLRSGSCDVALMGATSLEELDDSMGALDLRLSEEELEELRQVSELPAPYPMNFWNMFCYRESEFYGGLR